MNLVEILCRSRRRLGRNVVSISGGTVGGNNACAEIYQFEVDNSQRLNAVKR